MRIVHVITRLIVGGAQENTLLSCEGLQALGHDVHLLSGPTTGPEGSLVERARAGTYSFEELPSLVRQVNPVLDHRALRAMRNRFKMLRPDVVHTHSSKAGVLGRIAAHQAGVPVIVHTIHGMSFNRTQPRWLQAAYAFAERYCAKRCHAIACVADAMAQQALAAGIGRAEQYTTIRSGMVVSDFDPAKQDRAAVRREWGFEDEHIVIGTVARLFYNKGYEQIIDVMDAAAREAPNLRFVWVGDGAARGAYEEALRDRGLLDRVHLTGLLPPSEMPRVLSGIDILAHTSQWEGLPRAVVQSLLMEKPAITFAIDGAPEVVIPGETGDVVSLNDTKVFSHALVAMARDGDARRAMGRNGRAKCLQMFDHHLMVKQLDALYESIAVSR